MNTSNEPVNGSHESAETAYENQKAARRANIKAIEQERDRRALFARIALGSLAIFLVTVIGAIIAGVYPLAIVVACSFVVSTGVLVRVIRQMTRLEKVRDEIVKADDAARTQREIARCQREGIRARDERDVVVEAEEWNATNHVRTDWVQGEVCSLLPGDTVLKWNHGAWGGLCIDRKGKIIANRELWHIDW